MKNIEILIITSGFNNLEKLSERIYFEIDRDGYHNLTTETKDGIQKVIFVFNNLKNKQLLDTLISGYEYLNDSNMYFGKVKKIESYIAKEYTGSPIRVRMFVDNGEIIDAPEIAISHLQIEP